MVAEQIKLLMIEDNPGDARLVREMLAERSGSSFTYDLIHVDSVRVAKEKCSKGQFDAILLDLTLPDSTGLDTIQSLNDLFPHLPIIVLTDLNDERVALQCVQNGAQDYLMKGECTSQSLMRVIHYAIERKRVAEKLKYLATHDPLTDLPNRTLFYDRLDQALKRVLRNNSKLDIKWKGAVMILDLDHFKEINDSLGHEQGDRVLRLVARRFKDCLRQSDTVARLGGDEFIFILEGILDRTDCGFIAQRILKSLNETVIPDIDVNLLSASLGISIFPDDANDVDSMIRNADQAMYSAKRQGQDYCFYKEI